MDAASPLALDEVGPVFDRLLRRPLALAVSGGVDSTALMHLVADWAKASRQTSRDDLLVLTVDHGLRPGSAEDAARVAREATKLGLRHQNLAWAGPKPATGIQSAARAARYGLMRRFLEEDARSGRPRRAIVTAHHADDQAETFLMRLARGSGLDGLSGMREQEQITIDGGQCVIVRPLLQIAKARLLATLQTRGLSWCEDPSNRSDAFERVKIRKAMGTLSELGISASQIALSARRLGIARDAVLTGSAAAAAAMVDLHGGLYAEIAPGMLRQVPEHYRVRILSEVLCAFGGESPPARLSQVEALAESLAVAAASGKGPRRTSRATTLGGCRIDGRLDGGVHVWREGGRKNLPELVLQPGECRIWDARFSVGIAADEPASISVRPLGADGPCELGADPRTLDEVRNQHVPAGAIASLPSFWRGDRLVAIPYFAGLAGEPGRYSAQFVGNVALWAV